MIRERLAHASGALNDIQTLVTSCVAHDASDDAKKLARNVLRRILNSADQVRSRPSWYVHEYESELFESYMSGALRACSSDIACIREAKRLASDFLFEQN